MSQAVDCSGRMSAKNVLKEQITRHDGRADALRILLDVIEWDDLNPDEEAVLWGLFITMRTP